MSQAGLARSSGGGGSGITTIQGDSGSVTGSTVKIYAGQVSANSGASVGFANSGTTSTLNLTDSFHNTFIGKTSGVDGTSIITGNTGVGELSLGELNGTIAGQSQNNTEIGYGSGLAITLGSSNTGVGCLTQANLQTSSFNSSLGASSLSNLSGGNGHNTALGNSSLGTIVNGAYNLGLGDSSGNSLTFSDSSNILIANSGVTGDNNTIRIGTQGTGDGQQNKCYISGINGNTVSNQNFVTIDTSTGQLGTTSGGGSGFTTINVQTFTSNGTYTPTASMKYCTIECWGGGAGGGGTAATNVYYNGGGGGGAGGYSRKTVAAATIGASKPVTIGAFGAGAIAGNHIGSNAGDTSVGTICIAKGGSGGGGSGSLANAGGGAGGIAGTGDIAGVGQNGGQSISTANFSTISAIPGTGGSTSIGSGGFGAIAPNVVGGNATGYGAGGGGAQSQTIDQAGGDGTSGFVIITEYL